MDFLVTLMTILQVVNGFILLKWADDLSVATNISRSILDVLTSLFLLIRIMGMKVCAGGVMDSGSE